MVKGMTWAKVRGATRARASMNHDIDGMARLIIMVDNLINNSVLFLLFVKGHQVQPCCSF